MDANMPTHPTEIHKENVSTLQFPNNDVLMREKDRLVRRGDLIIATTLGNLEHSKVGILFEDIYGVKRVETTIWATTPRNIVLKGGTTIPVHRIHKIDFY